MQLNYQYGVVDFLENGKWKKEILLKELYHKLWLFASESSGFHFQICQTWDTEEFLFWLATNLMTIVHGGGKWKKNNLASLWSKHSFEQVTPKLLRSYSVITSFLSCARGKQSEVTESPLISMCLTIPKRWTWTNQFEQTKVNNCSCIPIPCSQRRGEK